MITGMSQLAVAFGVQNLNVQDWHKVIAVITSSVLLCMTTGPYHSANDFLGWISHWLALLWVHKDKAYLIHVFQMS